MNVVYTGCFFDRSQLYAEMKARGYVCLAREIEAPHVTFVYKPGQVDRSKLGTPVSVTVVGYGNDGRNEGVQVSLSCPDPQLQQEADAIPLAHITLSLARGAKAVNTGRLAFAPISEPFTLSGVYGAYQANGTVAT